MLVWRERNFFPLLVDAWSDLNSNGATPLNGGEKTDADWTEHPVIATEEK